MPRDDLRQHIERVETLAQEIEKFVPNGQADVVSFRADLAGLLVVGIAAAYESCVKDTMVAYAYRHHDNFGQFTSNRFSKLSSRIKINDLYSYARDFNPDIGTRFKNRLSAKAERIKVSMGVNIKDRYEQLLSWRHDYAHEGLKNTTIEEAVVCHEYSKRVIYSFNEAFDV